jgi:hypothetical protein
MPYITTAQVAEIRSNLKKQFPGVKFSVRKTKSSSGVDVSIMQSPFKLTEGSRVYQQLNHYYLDNMDYISKQAREFLKAVVNIIEPKTPGFYDSDYGQVPDYFVHLEVGKWDKPYIQK